jgi:hypothetical protein
VTVNYLLRHVIKGHEYYTEGKQAVQLVQGNEPWKQQLLVRADDTQQPMWQIILGSDALIAKGADGVSHRLLFNNFEAAESFAAWFNQSSSKGIGTDGITFSPARSRGEQARVSRYRFNCKAPSPAAAVTAVQPPTGSPAAPTPAAAGSLRR